MNRVILVLAIMTYGLAAVTMCFGLLSEPTADPLSLEETAFRYHFPLGLFTTLFAMFAHCLVFTYFLGTTRWVKETVHAYRLPQELVERSTRCRARAFAFALGSMLLLVLTVATGAGAHTKTWPVLLHQTVPYGTFLFMAWAFAVEYARVEEHVALTDEIMDRVGEIRGERRRA